MFISEYLSVSNTIKIKTNKIGLYNGKSQNSCQKMNQKKIIVLLSKYAIKQKKTASSKN